ncbi:hypothetical protein ON010_g12913 [Phytophthora cinnamomi]|nr:hypothetical protein ON010_g12913 [Phytophthora cinnamomi]
MGVEWSDGQLYHEVASHLDGEAKPWFATVMEPVPPSEENINTLAGMLRAKYLTQHTTPEVVDLLNARRQMRGKRLVEYAHSLKDIGECGDVGESWLVNVFLKGMNSVEGATHVRGNRPQTLDEAVRLAVPNVGEYGEGYGVGLEAAMTRWDDRETQRGRGPLATTGAMSSQEQSGLRGNLTNVATGQARVGEGLNFQTAGGDQSRARGKRQSGDQHGIQPAKALKVEANYGDSAGARSATNPTLATREGRLRNLDRYQERVEAQRAPGGSTPAVHRPGVDCFYCGRSGHYARECDLKRSDLAARDADARQDGGEDNEPTTGNGPRAECRVVVYAGDGETSRERTPRSNAAAEALVSAAATRGKSTVPSTTTSEVPTTGDGGARVRATPSATAATVLTVTTPTTAEAAEATAGQVTRATEEKMATVATDATLVTMAVAPITATVAGKAEARTEASSARATTTKTARRSSLGAAVSAAMVSTGDGANQLEGDTRVVVDMRYLLEACGYGREGVPSKQDLDAAVNAHLQAVCKLYEDERAFATPGEGGNTQQTRAVASAMREEGDDGDALPARVVRAYDQPKAKVLLVQARDRQRRLAAESEAQDGAGREFAAHRRRRQVVGEATSLQRSRTRWRYEKLVRKARAKAKRHLRALIEEAEHLEGAYYALDALRRRGGSQDAGTMDYDAAMAAGFEQPRVTKVLTASKLCGQRKRYAYTSGNVVAGEDWRSLGERLPTLPPVDYVEGFTGAVSKVLGVWRFRFRTQYDQIMVVDALVVKGATSEFLVGEDWMLQQGVKIDFCLLRDEEVCGRRAEGGAILVHDRPASSTAGEGSWRIAHTAGTDADDGSRWSNRRTSDELVREKRQAAVEGEVGDVDSQQRRDQGTCRRRRAGPCASTSVAGRTAGRHQTIEQRGGPKHGRHE